MDLSLRVQVAYAGRYLCQLHQSVSNPTMHIFDRNDLPIEVYSQASVILYIA